MICSRRRPFGGYTWRDNRSDRCIHSFTVLYDFHHEIYDQRFSFWSTLEKDLVDSRLGKDVMNRNVRTPVNLFGWATHHLHHHLCHVVRIARVVAHHRHHLCHFRSIGMLMPKIGPVESPRGHMHFRTEIQTKIVDWDPLSCEMYYQFRIVSNDRQIGRGAK